MVAEVTRLPARSIERKVAQIENTAAWQRVHHLAGRGHLSLIAERFDITDQSLAEIHSIATRRLRQLGGDDAA